MQNDLTRLDKIKKGCLLLADPNIINDPYFNRAVILITENSEDEVVGFIINKPLEYNFEDIFSGMGKDYKIYNGGPVNKDNLYYIHNTPNLIPNSIEVSDNLFWGGDFTDVKNLVKNNKIGSNNIRFFSGYSGWTLPQLNNEIKEKSWIITNNRFNDKILKSKTNEFWKEEIKKLGNDYKIWSNAPENPNLN
jgi:putative transcriptional regulator|tara:strand:- start:562 stop:1137 length:576 start_codon:yes stop_codon:yes gene_type:complete